jgi:hypothetical protein
MSSPLSPTHVERRSGKCHGGLSVAPIWICNGVDVGPLPHSARYHLVDRILDLVPALTLPGAWKSAKSAGLIRLILTTSVV